MFFGKSVGHRLSGEGEGPRRWCSSRVTVPSWLVSSRSNRGSGPRNSARVIFPSWLVSKRVRIWSNVGAWRSVAWGRLGVVLALLLVVRAEGATGFFSAERWRSKKDRTMGRISGPLKPLPWPAPWMVWKWTLSPAVFRDS